MTIDVCAWPDGCENDAVDECPICHCLFCSAHIDDETGACLWDVSEALKCDDVNKF